jgi:dTDP-4-dehydrorhamnose reductase
MVTAFLAGRAGPLQAVVVKAFRQAGFEIEEPSRVRLNLQHRRACRRALVRIRPDFVIDCSGAGDHPSRQSLKALDEMLIGSENLALAASNIGAHSVFISDISVFAERPGGNRVESDATTPSTPRGAAIAHAEQSVAGSNPRYTVVRSGALYGPQWPGRLGDLITRIRLTDEVRVEPQPVCPPTYTPHLADILVALVHYPCYGIIHRAGTGECNELELARTLIRLLDVPCQLGRVPLEARASASPPTFLASRREELPEIPHWRIGLRAWVVDQAPTLASGATKAD